jgi:hypothetical protein
MHPLEVPLASGRVSGTTNITAEVPCLADEFLPWKREPKAFLEKHFPGIEEVVEARGERLDELANMWGFTY